jgi:hypothetical protein
VVAACATRCLRVGRLAVGVNKVGRNTLVVMAYGGIGRALSGEVCLTPTLHGRRKDRDRVAELVGWNREATRLSLNLIGSRLGAKNFSMGCKREFTRREFNLRH